jgi:hypothetical protein
MQQWPHERASMLRCTYTACIVTFKMEAAICYENLLPRINTYQSVRYHTTDYLIPIKTKVANKTNQELDEIMKHKNIINFIRAQRPSWLGHIERMQGTGTVKVIHCWKHISRRPVGQAGRMMLEKIRRS